MQNKIKNEKEKLPKMKMKNRNSSKFNRYDLQILQVGSWIPQRGI